jgi:hypothetical protein
MRLIIYTLSTLCAWVISQRLLEPSGKKRHEISHRQQLVNSRKSILSYINPLFWMVYMWHGIQTGLLQLSSYIYYACPMAWIASIAIILTRLLWSSWHWQRLLKRSMLLDLLKPKN